jgi:hypothetical protein
VSVGADPPLAGRAKRPCARALAAVALSLGAAGCGGAAPLLHPAQVLSAGDVRAMGGIAARAAVGGLGDNLSAATNAAAAAQQQGTSPTVDSTYAAGALVAAAIAPDLSPVVGARVGVGGDFEGGLVYTGRGARVDLRRAFRLGAAPSPWALSVGLGLDAAFIGRQTHMLPGVDGENVFGFGGDVPVLVGWRSTAGLYYAWIGARFGYEHDVIQVAGSQNPPPLDTPSLVGDRFSIGGLLGVAMGFRHVHVALELEADYAYVKGSFTGVSAQVDGLSLTPASALWWDF